MTAKVRKTQTLDPDVVATFGDDPTALSAAVNVVLRAEMGRRARRSALSAFVDELDAEFGAPDPELIAEFERALR